MHLFLTGASGSVGVEFLRAIHEDQRFDRITCLLRGNGQESVQERWDHLLDKHDLRLAEGRQGPALEFVEGELALPGLGMSDDQRNKLSTSVTHILHSAAHIRFDAPYDEAHTINVVGTQHVIDFARSCKLLHIFGQVSTLYVVGTREGLMPEDAIPENSYNNAYEQTKYEAELLVRASGLPFDIYRLPLLQGRAEDGYVHHYLESHMLMQAFCRGSCIAIPGAASATLDMLPTDYTARILHKLITAHAPTGKIWSIAAGKNAPTMETVYQVIRKSMMIFGIKPLDQTPIHIDQARLQEILDSDNPSEHGVSPGACAILEIIADYLLHPKIFTPSVIPDVEPPPPIEQWLGRILVHCLNTGWGRRVVASAKTQDQSVTC